jgi:hypothetical protein
VAKNAPLATCDSAIRTRVDKRCPVRISRPQRETDEKRTAFSQVRCLNRDRGDRLKRTAGWSWPSNWGTWTSCGAKRVEVAFCVRPVSPPGGAALRGERCGRFAVDAGIKTAEVAELAAKRANPKWKGGVHRSLRMACPNVFSAASHIARTILGRIGVRRASEIIWFS